MGTAEFPDVDDGGVTRLDHSARRRFWTYLLPILVVPGTMLIAAWWLIPSRWLLLRSQNTYLANLGYGATLRGADCQVLIYGDSSAMVGVNPTIISMQTGLSACNIAEFEGMTILNGTMPLDQYLEKNVRPQFLIFLYTPEDFEPEARHHDVGLFEAITWRMQQPGKFQDIIAMMSRPDEFFVWEEQGLRLAVERSFKPVASASIQHFRADHLGQLPIEAPAMNGCGDTGYPHFEPDRSWVASLRAKYETHGSTVFIDATPLPDCDSQFAYFQTRLSGLIDNSIEQYPPRMFTIDGRLHVNAEGAARLSSQIAQQINQHLSGGKLSGGA